MLSKNFWIAISMITLATTAFIGCSNGGGGGNAPAPIIDCRLPQNYANLTCINARPGIAGRPYGALGGNRPVLGTFSRNPPNYGQVVLTVQNPNILMGLCFGATWYQNGNGVQRSAYDGNSSANYGVQNVNDINNVGFNDLCTGSYSTVVTFEIKQEQANQGVAYVAYWKLYFIPANVPVNNQTDPDQLKSMGPGSPHAYKAPLVAGRDGGFQAQAGGLTFSGVDNGTLTISIATRQGPIGSGVMTPR